MAASAEKKHHALLAGTALLVLLLGLQIVLANRDALAENPAWRPWISRLCLLASCQLEAWRQPEAFVPVRQAVAADRGQADVLIVQLSFRNDAQWPQPWPQIEIRLTDVDNQAIAMRRFRPKEYLNANQEGDIKPGQTVSVEIALQETSGKAAGFAFDFH
ncbi:MAG: hypothetical protein RLZZ537_836 [Pseudomonadota bacterium]|jgi:hypothetical protein